MDRKDKYIKIVDKILDQKLVAEDIEPSFDFVDKVMKQVEEVKPVTYIERYVKMAISVAAVAILFFMANSVIVFSSLKSSNQQQVNGGWSSLYEHDQITNWYDYYEGEVFIATNQTKNN